MKRYLQLLGLGLLWVPACQFLGQPQLQNFFPLEGTWTYQKHPEQNTWVLQRRVIDRQQQAGLTWYQVQETQTHKDGTTRSSQVWYARDRTTIFKKTSLTAEPTPILKPPGEQLASHYESYSGFPRRDYEMSVYVMASSEPEIAGFPCPCIEVNTSQVWIQGGSLNGSTLDRVVYAKEIGMVLDDSDTTSEKDTLISYKVGRRKL